MRYLSQRYSMPYAEAKGLLTDIGTEELGHMEMVAAIVHQLTRNLTDEEVRNSPSFAPYFVDHTTGVYPTAASGFPWSAGSISPRATSSLTLQRTWQQSRKPASPMTISCVSVMTRM